VSKETQNSFLDKVSEAERELSPVFDIGDKKVLVDGLVAQVSYSFGLGVVEFFCGPPEYHVEIFITANVAGESSIRYDLAKLMAIPHLRSWVVQNKPDMSHGDKLKAEIDWYVLLLQEIRRLPEFQSLT
jgi:hypothetical protein